MSIASGELLGNAGVEATVTRSPGPPDARSGLGRQTRGRLIAGTIMMAPFAVLLGGLLGWPIVWTFVLSFTNEQLTGPTALHRQFIGFANFTELFHDGGFGASFVHTAAVPRRLRLPGPDRLRVRARLCCCGIALVSSRRWSVAS